MLIVYYLTPAEHRLIRNWMIDEEQYERILRQYVAMKITRWATTENFKGYRVYLLLSNTNGSIVLDDNPQETEFYSTNGEKL